MRRLAEEDDSYKFLSLFQTNAGSEKLIRCGMMVSFTKRVMKANALFLSSCNSAIVWLLEGDVGGGVEDVPAAEVAPPAVVVVRYVSASEVGDEVLSLDVPVCSLF